MTILFVFFGTLLGILGLFLASILFFSGNKPEGGTPIAIKAKTEINGIEQGYFIRGTSEKNPVILFLHGGPGSPELPFIHNCELEKYFTVCYWDQRGAGMSYSADIEPNTMTVEQMIEDAKMISDLLRKKYKQEKIILMGHSWGTYLGIKTIKKYPQLYSLYIGIGQISYQIESERLAYDYIMNEAIKIKDAKTIKKLSKYNKKDSDFPTLDYLFKTRTPLMNKYKIGIKRDVSMLNLVADILYYRGYTLKEKLNYIRGTMFSSEHLFPSVLADNLIESTKKFEIPLCFVQGKYDYQVSYSLAKEYMDSISSPQKSFFTFENSAHSPNLEEPKRFVEVVRLSTNLGR